MTPNTEEIKRLAEIIKSANITEKNSYSLSVAKAIFNAGYLPSPSVVSPLVWETYLSDAERAFTPIGQYVVRNWGFPLNDRKVWGCYFNGTTICEKSTEEEAKKACQNHYQSLIGSCLQGGGYTKEQVSKFAEWLDDNDVRQQTEAGTGKTIFGIWEDLNGKRFTTKELFTLYLSSLKQQ